MLGFFTAVTAVLGLAPAIMVVLILDVVLRTQAPTLLPVLLAMSACALLGRAVVAALRTQILVGHQTARENYIAGFEACFACLALFVLGLVHPLLPLGAVCVAVVCASAVIGLQKIERKKGIRVFDRSEVTAALTGRAPASLAALNEVPKPLMLLKKPILENVSAVSFVATLALGGYLTGAFRISEGGMLAASLIAAEAARALVTGSDHLPALMSRLGRPRTVTTADVSDTPAETFKAGLTVQGLTIHSRLTGEELLSPVDLSIPRGGLVGLTGQGSGGKTLLLSCIQTPQPNLDTYALGRSQLDGIDLWAPRRSPQAASVVYVPAEPFFLSGTPAENLTCFSKDRGRDHAKAALLKVDVTGKHTDRMLESPDAKLLSRREGKILSLARAFELEPKLYLLDLPERDLSERSFYALLDQITAERELGRSFLVATENKSLLEACDEVLVLENGFVNDRGAGRDVLQRQSSGRHRIVVSRQLSSEERLHAWARSLYTRKGDEGNRDNASELLSELLALSCETAPAEPGYVTFDLQHQVGFSILKMFDQSPRIGGAVLEDMRSRAEEPKLGTRARPLWHILRASLEFSQDLSSDDGKSRATTVKFEIYDPRKTKNTSKLTHSSPPQDRPAEAEKDVDMNDVQP
ncbi:MAG: ATP-binding cassette domain-containing protein [Pseudomonadota bacterium]